MMDLTQSSPYVPSRVPDPGIPDSRLRQRPGCFALAGLVDQGVLPAVAGENAYPPVK
jgi:hypothetical protein